MAKKTIKKSEDTLKSQLKKEQSAEETKENKEVILDSFEQAGEKEPQSSDTIKEIKKQNHYIKVMLIVMAITLIIIAGAAWLRYKDKNFEYAGLSFQEIMFGEIQMYHAKIPITSITGEVIANFNLYLRNDPRSLEDIPIQERIILKKETIIALDPDMEDCRENSLASLNLGQFFGASGIKAIRGTTNITDSQENNIKYISCDNEVAIVTEKSGTTQIIKEGTCYRIQVADCNDVLKATERFIIGAIGHSGGYDVGMEL